MPTSTKPRPIPTPGQSADLAGVRRRPLRHRLTAGGVRRDEFFRAAARHATANGIPMHEAVRAFAAHVEEQRARQLARERGLSLFQARVLAAEEAKAGLLGPDMYRPPAGR